MKIHEFLETFLLNKEQNEKYQKYILLEKKQETIKDSDRMILCIAEMCRLENILFQEALQNFADKICEKQRERCAKHVFPVMGQYEDVLYAKRPLIEDLT